MLGAVGGAVARGVMASGAALGRAAAMGAGSIARGTASSARNLGTATSRAFSSVAGGGLRLGQTGGRAAGRGATPFTQGSTQVNPLRLGTTAPAGGFQAGSRPAQNLARTTQQAMRPAGRAGGAGGRAGQAGRGARSSNLEKAGNVGMLGLTGAGIAAPFFANPLKGLEGLLNPANWQQDLSWLGGILNPANFQQDLSWLEGLFGNLGRDIGGGLTALERFGETAFRDAEGGVKDIIWGAEELFAWAPWILGVVALLYVYSFVK